MCWNTPAGRGRYWLEGSHGASSTPMPWGESGKQHWALPRCPPMGQALSACSSPQRSVAPWRFCTSSLKGRGGTVLSRLNMSSFRSARRHSARLSTSFASGPTAADTGRDHKRAFMAEGLSRTCSAKTGPLGTVLS